MPEFPSSPYAIVRWRLAEVHADSDDPNPNPDWVPARGTRVVLNPSLNGPLVYTDPITSLKTTLSLVTVQGVIDSRGYLCSVDGMPSNSAALDVWEGSPLHIAATDDTNLSATGWVWTATVANPRLNIAFAAPGGSTVDLSDFVLAPANPATRYWVDRIPDLVAAVDDITVGPRGPSGTVTVASTTTSAPGTQASVTNSGTPENAQLHFTIPRGQDGHGGGGSDATWPVPGTPSTFPPSTHTHPISQVNGLQTALDGKQAAGSYQPAGSYATSAQLTSGLAGKQDAGNYVNPSDLSQVAFSGSYDDLNDKPENLALPNTILRQQNGTWPSRPSQFPIDQTLFWVDLTSHSPSDPSEFIDGVDVIIDAGVA